MNYKNYYNTNKYNNNQGNAYNSHSALPLNSSRSFSSFNSSFRRNNSSYLSDRPTKSNQQFHSNIQRTNHNFRPISSNNRAKPSFQHNNNTNNTNRNNNQTHQVNNITATHIPSPSQPTPLLPSSNFCTQSLETGHQASECPRF